MRPLSFGFAALLWGLAAHPSDALADAVAPTATVPGGAERSGPDADAGSAALAASAAAESDESASATPPALPAAERWTDASGARFVLLPSDAASAAAVCVVVPVGAAEASLAGDGFAPLLRAWSPGERPPGILQRAAVQSTHRTVWCDAGPSEELSRLLQLGAARLGGSVSDPAFAQLLAGAAVRPPGRDDRTRALERGLALLEPGAVTSSERELEAVQELSAEDRPAFEAFLRSALRRESAVFVVRAPASVADVQARFHDVVDWPDAAPLEPALAPPSPLEDERYAGVRSPAASRPTVLWGWRLSPDEAAPARELALAVVTLGPGARLVTGAAGRLADISIWWDPPVGRAGGVAVLARLDAVVTFGAVDRDLRTALRAVGSAGPTPDELERARSGLRLELAALRSSLEGEALLRADLEWARLGELGPEGFARRWDGVAAASVASAAAALASEDRRVLVEIHPPSWMDGAPARSLARYHIVQVGETLGAIASGYGVTVAALAAQNRLDPKKAIFPGQKLKLPAAAKKPPPPVEYVVKSGDSLIGIARRHGVAPERLASANGLDPKKPIFPGQRLVIPAKGGAPAAAPAGPGAAPSPAPPSTPPSSDGAPATAPVARQHTVAPGESLIGIAQKYGVTADALAGANGLDSKKPIFPGQKLTVPAPRSGPTTGGGASPPAGGGAAPAAPTKPAAPREHVVGKGDTLTGIAARYGVSVAALVRANGLDPKKPIRPGQKLVIPPKP